MGTVPNEATTVEQEAACGCWVSRSFHPDGELLELHVQICEAHMNSLSEDIELRVRSETDQLTLPLPSPEGDRGRDHNNG